MKAGTIIKFSDGRFGTVVYNGLDGVGIIWGQHYLTDEQIAALYDSCTVFGGENNEIVEALQPEAMLRKPYTGAMIKCVDMEYEITEQEAL